jgi:hypothetical protein
MENLTITLYKSELIYDVQNKTYLTGRSRQNGNNHEEVANMQANNDDENLNQLLRSIGNAHGSLKTKLAEFMKENDTTSNDKLYDDTGSLTLSLNMPSNYNNSTAETIATACHQYIVNMATADWFTITNKNDASDYMTLAAANLEQLREALNKRVRPTHTAVTGS